MVNKRVFMSIELSQDIRSKMSGAREVAAINWSAFVRKAISEQLAKLETDKNPANIPVQHKSKV